MPSSTSATRGPPIPPEELEGGDAQEAADGIRDRIEAMTEGLLA